MGITEKREKTKETLYLVLGLIFVSSVYLSAFIRIYTASNVVRETTFTVFDKHSHPSGRTHVLTYGDGKYIFLGNHTAAFELDHTYHVTYYSSKSSHATMANPPRYFLKILKITEIS